MSGAAEKVKDATGLSRGDLMLVAKQILEPCLQMPHQACPVKFSRLLLFS